MRRIYLAVLLCGLAVSFALAQDKPCRPAKHARLPTITNITYHRARKMLLAAGWQPEHLIRERTCLRSAEGTWRSKRVPGLAWLPVHFFSRMRMGIGSAL